MSVADPRYDEGYWERGEGSNYVDYGPDPGWPLTAAILARLYPPHEYPLLLEIGCAKGFFLQAAYTAAYTVTGCDVSQWALDHPAPGMAPHMLLGSAVDLPFGDALFDIVCSWEVLEHIEEAEIDQAMREMIRVLRPGGVLVHRIGMLESAADLSHHLEDKTHVLNEPSAWWHAKFEEHGLVLDWDASGMFNRSFIGRDWCGRFVVACPE